MESKTIWCTIAYNVHAGALILRTDRDGILREVQAVKSQAEEALKLVERHKVAISACDQILEERDTPFAEKKQQDARISNIENEVKGLGAMLKDFINEFKK